jgi:alpha-galactosidase
VDVASMGKLGFDIVFNSLSENDKLFCKQAISNYNKYKEIVWHGDLFRLVNPHENEFASLMYVNPDKNKAVVFNYLVSNRQRLITDGQPVKLKGLSADKIYKIKEINLYPNTPTPIRSDQSYSGDFLMKVGINPQINERRNSVVLEISEVK